MDLSAQATITWSNGELWLKKWRRLFSPKKPRDFLMSKIDALDEKRLKVVSRFVFFDAKRVDTRRGNAFIMILIIIILITILSLSSLTTSTASSTASAINGNGNKTAGHISHKLVSLTLVSASWQSWSWRKKSPPQCRCRKLTASFASENQWLKDEFS